MSGSTKLPTNDSLINQKDTAIVSYSQEKGKHKTQANQQLVLNSILRRGRACDREIMQDTGLPINIVSARRNELVERGLVVESGKGLYPETGKNVIMWKRVSDQAQLFDEHHLSSQKRRKKIENLCKLYLGETNKPASELAKEILEILNKK